MTTKRDYYDVLELPRSAATEDIKKAYRKLALKYHPDRNKDADASTRFKEINEAYHVLSDPERKAVYDRYGHSGLKNGGAGAQGFSGFDNFGGFGDIFEAFFGGASTRQGPRRGADIEYQARVSFRDAVFGTKQELELDRYEICARCNGTRSEPDHPPQTCSSCRGSGQVRRVQRTVFGQFQQVTTCSNCSGSGETISVSCSACNGRGRERRKRRLMVEIPAGIDDNSRIRMRRQGEAGDLGGDPGDLYVHVIVDKDPVFVRDGDDVLMSVDVNVAQAALGTEIEVPTLDGSEDLRIPAGTQSGQVFRIRGAGVPHLGRTERRGDQLVTVNVTTPTKLSDRQRELLEELADSLGAAVVGGKRGDNGLFGRIKDAFTGEDR